VRQQTPACPYCNQQVDAAATRCPNCGAVIPRENVWPPPSGSMQPVPQHQQPELMTTVVWGDVVLGIAVSVGLYMLWNIGVVAIPILYALLRKKYPIFSRSLGWCYIVPLILLGGVFLACAVSSIYSKF